MEEAVCVIHQTQIHMYVTEKDNASYITDPDVYSLEGIISWPSAVSSGSMLNVESVVAMTIHIRLSTRYNPGQLLVQG